MRSANYGRRVIKVPFPGVFFLAGRVVPRYVWVCAWFIAFLEGGCDDDVTFLGENSCFRLRVLALSELCYLFVGVFQWSLIACSESFIIVHIRKSGNNFFVTFLFRKCC